MRQLRDALLCMLLALLCVFVTLLIAAEFEDRPEDRPGFVPGNSDVW